MALQLSPLPPGPQCSPIWQLFRYTNTPLRFLEECRRRHGDPFTIRLAGFGTFIMLSDPNAIRDVFHGDPDVLHSGEGNEFLTITVGPTSVLVLDEEPHARQRRILLPPLKGERMRSFFNAMQSATLEAVRAWPVGQTMRMDEPMRRITLRVILRAVLGLTPGPQLEDFEELVNGLLLASRSRRALLLMQVLPLQLLKSARGTPFFRRLHALDHAIYAFTDGLRRQPAAARGETVLADLLAASHENGEPLSNQEIRDAVLTILLAGHETTSLALAWALEQIAGRPNVMARLHDELSQTIGGAPPSADQLSRLEYLDAAIRESLRLRTILPFVVRLTKKAFVAGGREYPPGVVLCPCNHLVHRREDLYPEPRRFRPERFLERRFGPYEWFPFGGGNRVCLGMAFALYEMKVVLGTLFSQVRLARPPGSRSVPIRLGVTLGPDDGARAVVVERLDRK